MAKARATQHLVEALIPTDTFDPTTVTGAGVTQETIEVLGSFVSPARVTQIAIEVLLSDSQTPLEPPDPCLPSGGGGVRVYGYAG